MKTLALIGLPGCGKTSVGKELAEKLGLGFADCDEEVERQAGMTIPALFEQEGEGGFRARETAVLYHLVVKDHYVVATGGGVVTRPENRDNMKEIKNERQRKKRNRPASLQIPSSHRLGVLRIQHPLLDPLRRLYLPDSFRLQLVKHQPPFLREILLLRFRGCRNSIRGCGPSVGRRRGYQRPA